MDFSWVRSKAGLLSSTETPAPSSCLRAASFSSSPLRRAGLSITCTLMPRCCAATTASSSDGSLKTNILIRSERLAASIASRIGFAESSGRTITERAMSGSLMQMARERHGRVRRGSLLVLNAVQLGVDAPERNQLVVRALLRDDAVLEDDDLVRVANRRQSVGDGDHRPSLHESLEPLDDEALGLGVER